MTKPTSKATRSTGSSTAGPSPRPTGRLPAGRQPAVRGVPPWLPRTVLVLCAVGVLVSGYLTWDTFVAGAALACPEGETINCAKVTQSEWSKLFGIPVAPLGLLFFVGMAVLSTPARFRSPNPWWDRGRLAYAGVGMAMVVYLVWAELFRIQAICLWCTVVHVLTFAILVVLLFGQALIEPAPTRQRYKDRIR